MFARIMLTDNDKREQMEDEAILVSNHGDDSEEVNYVDEMLFAAWALADKVRGTHSNSTKAE